MEHNQNSENESDLTSIFGEIISKYTRADALRDGELVDVSPTAREAGFRFPCAVTRALWNVIQTIPDRCPWEDPEGRLWDVIWMAKQQAGKCKEGVSRFVFELILTRTDKRSKYTQLVMDCGPGDNGEPVLTVGFAEDF